MKILGTLSKYKDERNNKYDRIFLITVMLLTIYGSIMVFTSGYAYALFRYDDAFYFIKRQIVWVALGIITMLLVSRCNNSIFKKVSWQFYVITLSLLLLTLLVGFVGNGAKRWISIGPITIQPSEIAKLSIVMMLGWYFDKNENRALNPKNGRDSFVYGTLLPFTIMLIPILLVMLQKHLSCIIILGMIGLLLIVMSGINLKYITAFIVSCVAEASYIAFFTDYTKDRITVWQNPEAYKLTGGWQTLQGLMAIGSGGLLGKGLGNGELKHCYVSEPANDMIFAILCEELGFIGALIALILFGVLVCRGFLIGFKSANIYDRLLCIGISTKIAIQTLLNVAVVTNTIPNTGISLPFFSYGGSSLLMLFLEMGIILSISKNSNKG